MQELLSPACSPRQPSADRPLGNSKEILDEFYIEVTEVESPDAMEHLEDPARKKSLRTRTSVFSPKNTSIANFLSEIIEKHSNLCRITVKEKFEQFWKGDIICKKMKETMGDQEFSFSKMDIFDRQKPIFVGVHPSFEQKSEGSKVKEGND